VFIVALIPSYCAERLTLDKVTLCPVYTPDEMVTASILSDNGVWVTGE